jgi:hypothetical protein
MKRQAEALAPGLRRDQGAPAAGSAATWQAEAVSPKLLGGGISPKALTWAFASSVAKSSGYMLTSANVIMVSGHGHGFSVQKNHALISVPAGQGRNIYAELQ